MNSRSWSNLISHVAQLDRGRRSDPSKQRVGSSNLSGRAIFANSKLPIFHKRALRGAAKVRQCGGCANAFGRSQ